MKRIGIPALLLILLGAVAQARAEEPSAPATDAVPSPVGLDALLRLPSQAPTPEADPAQALTRKDWEARFAAAREDVASARAALAASQAELEKLASGNAAWQMAPPGASANAENSPVSFKLRQDIRRQREDVERAERALTELRIEANLAGVPEDWQD
ncbi:MAG TPA: hypothetical protein VIY27_03670 [Myxococcota bacterium]